MNIQEKIAQKLCELDGWTWEDLDKIHKRFYNGSAAKSHYLRKSLQILKEIATDLPVLTIEEINQLPVNKLSGLPEPTKVVQASVDKVKKYLEGK